MILYILFIKIANTPAKATATLGCPLAATVTGIKIRIGASELDCLKSGPGPPGPRSSCSGPGPRIVGPGPVDVRTGPNGR